MTRRPKATFRPSGCWNPYHRQENGRGPGEHIPNRMPKHRVPSFRGAPLANRIGLKAWGSRPESKRQQIGRAA